MKMTEKLYYLDAYISEFTATVLSLCEKDGKYEIVLDKTAFFPEEGGQSADTGMLGDATVLDVFEQDGTVVHITDKPLSVGENVGGVLNFSERYEKMKCHTAEHILCGIMHRLFGAENIGFHLGEDVVTFDVSPVLTRAELDEVEDIANRIVAENIPVTTSFPTADELSGLTYRAKLDITENVRLVHIGEYDTCACCAPHVAYTGEIGLIKMLDFEKHRGGTRIYMLAGTRALIDYRERYSVSQKISALTSTPQKDIATAVELLMTERDNLAKELKEQRLVYARSEAMHLPPTDKNAVVLLVSADMDALRELVNCAVHKVSGMLVALSGTDGDYKYVIGSKTVDLKPLAREINAALGGRGGGRSEMIQGSFTATVQQIRAYFE